MEEIIDECGISLLTRTTSSLGLNLELRYKN